MVTHFTMEPRISRDDRILLMNRKGEIETVVNRMVEVDC